MDDRMTVREQVWAGALNASLRAGFACIHSVRNADDALRAFDERTDKDDRIQPKERA